MRRRAPFAAPLVMVVACGQAPPGAIPVEAPAGMEPAVAVVKVKLTADQVRAAGHVRIEDAPP